MKKLLYIAFMLTSLAHAQVQVDTTNYAISPDRDGFFYKVSSTAFGLDKIRAFEKGGEIFERFNTGTWQNNHFGIYTNGANQRAKVQAAFDSSYVDKMVITNDQGGAIFLQGDSIDFHGKTLEFEGNVYLKGDPANKTKLKNVMIVADPTSFIIDTSFVLGENVKFTTGKLSVKNFGAGKNRTFRQNMAIFTMINDYAGLYKGQTVLFPADNYLVGRRGTKIIPGKSYTIYEGEGMYKTTFTLDTSEYRNFRRIFDLNDGDSSITIRDMGFNMRLKGVYYDSVAVDFEGDPGEPAHDYQCMPIFTYSSDSTKPVFDVRIENIYAEDIPGDVVGISKNTNYVHIKNIRFRNYIRQGISLGGGNVRDVWIEDVFDLGMTTVLQVGGHSIHCEPSSIQWNINYLNSTVRDFSYSGVGSGSIIGITTTSNNDLLCNLVSNTEITDNTLNGRLQVSANSRGNIKINNNRELNAGVTFTTVSGASGSPAPSFITGNKKIIGINAPAIQLLNVDSITVSDNNVQNTGDATISSGNCRSTIITRNRAKKNGTGNYPVIYTYSTTTSNYGAGMDYIDGNIVEGSYRGIVVGNKSAVIGPSNVVTAPTPYELSTAKIFPYRGPDGRQTLVYKTSGLPNYNDWVKGDVIIVNTTTAGEPTKYICDTTGGLHRGNWNAVGPYYRNEYVRDSTNGRVYRSKASNGQNELPSADTDNTYWEQVATRTAVFSAVEWYRDKLKGYGAPTTTNNIVHGTEYIRLDGDTCNTKYTYYTGIGWKPTGCGGGSGGLSQGQVAGQISDSLSKYQGVDSLGFVQGYEDDSLKTTFVTKDGESKFSVYIPRSSSPTLTSANVGSFTGLQRLSPDGNTVFDIMDVNTGVYFNATKRTTVGGTPIVDSLVDNKYIWKKGSDYYVKDFDGPVRLRVFVSDTSGTTDVTTQVQQAINTAIRLKRPLYVDAGLYRINGTLYVNKPIGLPFTIYGDGELVKDYQSAKANMGAVFIKYNSGDIFRVNLKADGSPYSNYYDYQLNVGFKGFSMRGHDTAHVYGIREYRTRASHEALNAVLLDAMVVQDGQKPAGYGGTWENYSDQSIYKNLRFYNPKYAGLILSNSDNSTISDMFYEYPMADATYFIRARISSGLKILGVLHSNGNDVMTLKSESALIRLDTCKGITITGGHIETSRFNSIFRLVNCNGFNISGYASRFEMRNYVSLFRSNAGIIGEYDELVNTKPAGTYDIFDEDSTSTDITWNRLYLRNSSFVKRSVTSNRPEDATFGTYINKKGVEELVYDKNQKATFNYSGSPNFVMTNYANIELPAITQATTIRLLNPALYPGRTISVINRNKSVDYNTSLNSYNIWYPDSTSTTQIPQNSVTFLKSDSTRWNVVSMFRNFQKRDSTIRMNDYLSISTRFGESGRVFVVIDSLTDNEVLDLPSAVTANGLEVNVVRKDASNYYVRAKSAVGGQTINGQASDTIRGAWTHRSYLAYGGNWYAKKDSLGAVILDSTRTDSSFAVTNGSNKATIKSATPDLAGALASKDYINVNRLERRLNFVDARTIIKLDTAVDYRINGREFYYDPSDVTSADDSAMTIVTTGGGRLKQRIERGLNPKWWGAVGNGTTDDSKAFNKMFRWIEGSRKKMYEVALEPTTYLLQDTIFLPKVITGVNSMATLRITGNGTLLKKTSTGVMLWRVPADITEAQDYIGSYKLILDGVDFLGDNTGQKAIVASSFYTAQLKNCTFTTFDTAVILPFWLNGIIEGNVFTNCKTQAFIGCSLSGYMASGNTSNSAFNANYFHKNRVVNRVNSFSAFMFMASDGCVIDDNISEGQNPRYDMYIDCQAATVANGIVIKNTWFESTGSGINTSFFLRHPNIVIDGFQNDYADTLFNSSNAIVNQRVHITNIAYIPAGMKFNGGGVYKGATSLTVDGSNDVYLDYFLDTAYWVGGVLGCDIKVKKLGEVKTNFTETIRPNIYATNSNKQYRVEANIIATDNTYWLGRSGSSNLRYRGVYVGDNGVVISKNSSFGYTFGDVASNGGQGFYQINDSVLRIYSTGALRIPYGTTAQRVPNFASSFRYNTTLSQFEGNNGSSWKRFLFSPYTTSGDIMYWDGTAEARLGVGSTGQILKVSGGLPSWQNEPVYTLAKNSTRDSTILRKDGVQVSAVKDSIGAGGNATSGTWTPTFTSVANVASYTFYHATYIRVDSIVTFSLSIQVAATDDSIALEIRASLPIASNFNQFYQAHGSGTATATIPFPVYCQSTSSGTGELRISSVPNNTSGNTYSITGQYIIR